MTTQRIYVLEWRDNSGNWWYNHALIANNPLDAWHESAQWIKANAKGFGSVWKLPNGQMDPTRWRVITAFYEVKPKRRASRLFQSVDLEIGVDSPM